MTNKAIRGKSSPHKAVTADRAGRLYRLLKVLGKGPQTREFLCKKLRVDERGFYRDLGLLRAAGIGVEVINRKYHLQDKLDAVIASLPFPDPHLTLAEAISLARGNSAAHRKLKAQIQTIIG
jgi:predicted DNA-binding transcriptional regulator YafY